jgi:hypothetical protein
LCRGNAPHYFVSAEFSIHFRSQPVGCTNSLVIQRTLFAHLNAGAQESLRDDKIRRHSHIEVATQVIPLPKIACLSQ